MELSKLRKLVNTNFSVESYWVTLAYVAENAPRNVDEAEVDLKEWLNKHEIQESKYVAIFSKEKGRFYIYLFVNFPDRDSAERGIWEKGRSVVSRLKVNELSGLVGYACSGEVVKILLSLD
ncbi:hypothetical protein P4604_18380 [Lysinibacillus capsici]|uniref:hypothetical protein n=1 Tax=Lysinibacillus capsici TaxID=2115968 RepID=UPI002E1D31E2|nr:hypothetical protein [Lysinibacillus capsici]